MLTSTGFLVLSHQIKLWDVRVRRSVQQYEGHHNEYAYLPLHLSEREGLVLAGIFPSLFFHYFLL